MAASLSFASTDSDGKQTVMSTNPFDADSPAAKAFALASIIGTIAGAYHGYKRNDSVGWAIGWALLGGIAPYITLPVSYAQGFGKRAK